MRTGYELQRFERLEAAFFDYADDDDCREIFLADLRELLKQYQQDEKTRYDWATALLKRFA